MNEAHARRMGATDFVLMSEDPERVVNALTGGRGADVVNMIFVMCCACVHLMRN